MLEHSIPPMLRDRQVSDAGRAGTLPSEDWATRLASTLEPLVQQEGFSETAIDGVRLIASRCSHPRTPLIYEPGLFFIAQGDKIGYLEGRTIHYGPGNYLVQAMPLPFECETLARPDAPLLGISIAVDPLTLSELVHQMPTSLSDDDAAPMAAVALDRTMAEAVQRLADCLHDEAASRALGAGRVREVLFAALNGPQGQSLRQLVQRQGHYARIAESLDYLHRHFAAPLTVEALAARANMSASHFHHHFKRVTQVSPVQYLKRLRLLRARVLLSQQRVNVARAASEVGYRSTSQFSREYKRYFGVSPSQD
ncbi:AraC family transcriptional regulator [Salinicola rhizosphaerae]|uniref:AraC family transcriptional regulator n=1 Tax=Salinicola rhizosphaerae TaxID=1443141 RepID=A0ABQ3ECR0_9GAMM|nr:AraC family transcriptional regulator [Salinicola rhizosphaerae]GHB32292.1 AraC family transcriptional regulator [Salinicola rhizosphaerae]